jgi:hypothetical protein
MVYEMLMFEMVNVSSTGMLSLFVLQNLKTDCINAWVTCVRLKC